MNTKKIKVYYTHIEVYPYEKGEYRKLENYLSKFDAVTHQYIPVGYLVMNNTLFLPRGIDIELLKLYTGQDPIIVKNPDAFELMPENKTATIVPRDDVQKKCIDFLESKGAYRYGTSYTQFCLNLRTGGGKTVVMTKAILDLRMKAIIIVDSSRIKKQWYDTLLGMTNLTEDDVYCIEGTPSIEKIFQKKVSPLISIVNHQTLQSYAREHTWMEIRNVFKQLKIGIKVIDEAHSYFHNVLFIDYFTNVNRSYYLSATLSRTDPREATILNKAFASAYKFGANIDYFEKHTIYIAVLFDSHASLQQQALTRSSYGFSAHKYIDYEITQSKSLLHSIFTVFTDMKQKNVTGKTLIVSPKKTSVEYFQEKLKERFPTKLVTKVYSKQKQEENAASLSGDILSSTIKSLGTGADIKDLQVLINTEPHSSENIFKQVLGRLRPYKDNEPTYLYDMIDISIPGSYEMYQHRLKVAKKECKDIQKMIL